MPYNALDRAEAYILANQLDDALEAITEHLRAERWEDDEAWRLHAAVCMRIGSEPYLAFALYDLDNLQIKSSTDWLNYVTVLRRLNDDASAYEAVQQARQFYPSDERLIEQQLSLLYALDEREAARGLLRTLPRTWRWLRWSGDMSEPDAAVSDYTDALGDLERQMDTENDAFAANTKAQLLLRRAEAHQHLGNLNEADADYRLAQAIIPTDPMIGFNRGLLAALRGDVTEALALCGEALTRAGDTLRVSMERALTSDPRYAALAVLLLQGDQDV